MSSASQVAAAGPAAGYTSVEGASAYTSLSVNTIRRLIADGKLPSHKIGGRVLIGYPELERLVRGETASPAGA